jgi:carboxyl-terminal processing protease
MPRVARTVQVLLLLLLTLSLWGTRASVAAAPVSGGVWLEAPTPAQAAPPPSAAAVNRALAPLQQAYRLLLDRYVDPLPPSQMATAALQGMSQALADQGVTPGDLGPPAPSNDRAGQWQRVAQRFRGLAAQYGAEVPPRELAYAAIAAMADSVDDTHTQFMTPRDYQEYRAWTRGDVHYGGIGARLRGPEPTIVEVYASSPAASAGLQPGDVILAVDDQPVAGLKLDDIVNRVRGPDGTSVRMRVRRAATAAEQDVMLTRAQVSVPFVDSHTLGDVGYVALRGFPEPSVVDAVERAVLALQAQGVRGLVFDLRGNSGGRLDVGTQLLGRFVADGPAYQIAGRQERPEVHQLQGGRSILSVPLAVLVDEGTASMGELFAATIQERGVGRVLGATTAGSVAASVVQPLGDGSALQLSVEHILSGQGRALDRVGVSPDQPVPLDAADLQRGRDPQLDAALGYLHAVATTAGGPASRP